ncbi:acetylornithine deacetylase [Kibdelosporangium banguiense]|uniref:Acetylornithine deacetylase n=1 Tax=Kibdelosporangium banguiense TaxID=1365924 RepID=A0ABS4U0W8_9PSEU|nr:M20/M25/M40 family metallo-hydrolase [Kibdelosporangium banguiense]MBP2330284.1 acetylornithine deacetylase [Kibdelosporangium banguiense]
MREEVIELLKRLVEIDSVNASLVPGAAGEAAIARFVAGWATDAGLRAEIVGDSVIVRSNGGPGRKLLLCGHLDTVGLGGVTDPLVPRIEGDRLYGRGAYDMKAGLAAALIACRDSNGLAGEVIVAAVSDEEHSSVGIQETLPHLQADAAIVCEPTELTIAVAHKGFAWTEIEVHGKAAHGSRPHLGVDAILKTGPILVALDKLDRSLRDRSHELLGSGSLHASLISGGREETTIPDRCVLTVERRTLPYETLADVEQDIADLLDSCMRADPELKATSRTTQARDGMQTPQDAEIVKLLAEVAGNPEITGASYWADSAFISSAGIPTVLYGPGGEGAHADVEWVSIADTIKCASVLTAAARRFCG